MFMGLIMLLYVMVNSLIWLEFNILLDILGLFRRRLPCSQSDDWCESKKKAAEMHNFSIQQESLAKAKVSARQQCVYEDQFCHLTVV